MNEKRILWAAVASLVWAYLAAVASAGTISSVNNGDFSAGDTRNWVIEQNAGAYVFGYQDVGTPYYGTLHTAGASNGYGSRAWHTTLCDVGSSGSIQVKLNSLTNGGTFAFCFLGDPVYSSGGIPLSNNNDSKRGYIVSFSQSYGTFSAILSRKTGGWARTDLTNWSVPYTSIAAGWHTITVRDNLGSIYVEFDGQTILTAGEGANYLPTAYAADYANGGLWGVFIQNNVGPADVNFDNLMVGGAPVAVTDLAATTADWFQVNLAWTAPTDFPAGPVAGYDIRYSTSAITDANWASATQCTGEPVGVTPGQPQTFAVTGLTANTMYYFAMKAIGGGGKVSPLSNVVSPTTNPIDVVAPAAVSNLSYSDVRSSRVTLSWTASGDDGVTGTAKQYDVRYSTSPIDGSNFASAMQATGVPTPKAAGQAETFILRGLSALSTYYVAIKVADEVPNWSGISNVATFGTPAADLTPPATITDLRLTGTYIHAAYLVWTAPIDTGGTGTGAYDIRYSTSSIDDSNWGTATQVTGAPVPSTSGTLERFTVTGLNADTTYYFAVKTLDQAEPPNVSAVSNVVSGHTMPPVLPITIHNPWIANDRVADCRSLTTMGNTFDKAYTPDGVVTPADTETRVINNYNNFKRRLYHWGEMPPNNADVGYQLNVFGWALCGSQASMNAAIIMTMGLSPRTLSIASGGHTYMEVNYGGKWHAIDTMCTYYVYDRGSPRSLACEADVKADHNLVMNAVAEGRACPGFLLCGDTPDYFATGADTWQVKATPGDTATTFSSNMDIRMGEAVQRTCQAWTNQWPTTSVTPPYHHEAANDWKDYVNLPYWEPYKLDSTGNSAIGITYSCTYRRWANGTIALAPDFRSAGYQASLLSGTNIATFNDDGLTPDLHPATAGALATAIFKIATPYYITDGNISGTFFKKAAGDVNRIWVSTDGSSYVKVWDNATAGTTQLSGLSIRTQVRGSYGIWVKVELQGATAKTDAGVSNLVITPTFEHNKGGMAYLDKGVNHITVTLDNPQDLATGAAFKVTYKWKEYSGTDWTVDRVQEQYVTASPTTFTITTAGAKVPRTEYILMEVTAPPMPDGNPPAPIANLAVTGTDSTKVNLAWTATGDDWDSGQAASYDLRYSTSPINNGNWDAASRATGLPAPQVAGSAEAFTVTGLAPSTTYYFAIKAKDEGGNIGDLSNVPSGTTLAPDLTPPAWVKNLVALQSKTAGGVDLTWTATGDDGDVGTAASYDLRYSTSAITEANFAAATHVTGVPAPKVAGSAEAFTVTGLTGGTFYYFALKVVDDAVPSNVSEISNVSYAPASVLGEKVLQWGVNGYTSVHDNFTEAGVPTTNFGTSDHMRICGYGAGTTNVQRGLLQFDVSGIPAGVSITKATLGLYAYDLSSLRGSSGFYGVYPLTKAWSDTASTWNNATASVAWTTAGGDASATADGTSPKQGVANVWYLFDVTARVQSWVSGTSTNNGWLIRCANENNSNQDMFYSSDTSNGTLRPYLVISDLPTPVVGDLNGDGAVDVVDLLYFVDSWGLSLGDRGYDPKCDFNGDGAVDVVDLLMFVDNWGT